MYKKRNRYTSNWTFLLEETMGFHEVLMEENPISQLIQAWWVAGKTLLNETLNICGDLSAIRKLFEIRNQTFIKNDIIHMTKGLK